MDKLQFVEPGSVLASGTQIAYVPQHCSSLTDYGVEFGFVTSTMENYHFCRYWFNPERGSDNPELRTRLNSELTPTDRLVLYDTADQEIVEALLVTLYNS